MEGKKTVLAKELDGVVYPSDVKTIVTMVPEDDVYGGAHEYYIVNCLGFNNGKTDYQFEIQGDQVIPKGQKIQFIQKHDDGTLTPGLQSEQLVLMLLDRTEKLNARFPSAQNEKMMAGLKMFLDAARERVEERMNRGVMGELKK